MRSQSALGLISLGADNLVDETLIVFQGLGRPGDLDIHGSAGGHGLEVLGAHDASHPGAASGILDPGHDVRKPDQVLSGGPADAALDFLVAQVFTDGPLGFRYRLAPDAPGIPNLDFAVVDIKVNGMFRLPLDDQVMKPGPG